MTDEISIHVALVRDFVNTLDVETGEDALAEPASLLAWLLAALAVEIEQARPADVRRALKLREALRQLLLANNHVDVSTDAARNVVEASARRGKVELRFAPTGDLVPTPVSAGLDGALGSIVAAAARSMQDGTWLRLKACRAEACRWAYYDRTRNHCRAWCSMETCGNREKVRLYRTRRATT